MYISVTGLRLNTVLSLPVFWRYTLPAMVAARRAPGNLSADARKVGAVHHTLSTWESRAHMRAYLRSPSHARAMPRFAKIATGRVVGWDAAARPEWDEALHRLATQGRDVYG
ncbi:MAG: hypothetical protein AAGM84_05815 [Pseudomonadota bacterium]